MNTIEKNSLQIEHLREQINLIHESVVFNFTLFWGIIAVLIAGLSVALVIMIRKWVEFRVDKEIEGFKQELRLFEKQWFRANLTGGWISDEFETPSYSKDYFEWVHLRGAVRGGHAGEFPIFTLPVGWRPAQITTYNIMVGDYPNMSQGKIIINPSGQVIVHARHAEVVYLNGISFQAEK